MMKATVYRRYGPPEVLEVVEEAMPTPRPNEILIRIHAAPVTTTDCALRSGDLLTRLPFGVLKPKRPRLGTELAGEVVAAGRDVLRFRPGDRVYAATGATFGTHAQYICLPHDGAIAPMPENASFAEAAALCEGGLTALPFLRDEGKRIPGQRVLINGAAGAVGNSALQLAKAMGAEVAAVCGPHNLELMLAQGADIAIDYQREDFTKRRETYDIVFDAVGKSSFTRCRSILAPQGAYLGTVPTPELLAQMLWTSRRGRQKARMAATGLRPAPKRAADLLVLKAYMERGALHPLIDSSFGMSEVATAHRRVETGHKRGHVILTMA